MDVNITSNFTVICQSDIQIWYPVCAGILLCVSVYMLAVSILYCLGYFNRENQNTDEQISRRRNMNSHGTKIQKNLNRIIVVVWILSTLGLICAMVQYTIGNQIYCGLLSSLFKNIFIMLGLSTIYGCLWYRSWVTFAHSNAPKEKIRKFKAFGIAFLILYIIISTICTGLLFYEYYTPKSETAETKFEKSSLLPVLIFWPAWGLICQTILLLMFTYPIQIYRKQMENSQNQSETQIKVLKLLTKLRLIALLCVTSGVAFSALGFIPGVGVGIFFQMDVVLNGLLLVLSFSDPLIRFGFSWFQRRRIHNEDEAI